MGERRQRLIWIGILVLCMLVSMMVGAADLSLESFQADPENVLFLLVSSRLPRTLAIILAGAALSLSGLIMQAITRNKFAGPSTMGTNEATRLAVVLLILFLPNYPTWLGVIVGGGGAFITTIFLIKILERIKFKNEVMTPLVGMMFGNILGALASSLAYQANVSQLVDQAFQGSFSTIMRGNFEWLFITLIVMVALYLFAEAFGIMQLGESWATNFGVNYKRLVLVGVLLVSLASSVVMVVVGNLPFLGIVVPNIIKRFNGDSIRQNILPTSLFGAIFLLIADIFSRLMIYPYEIPVTVTVSIFGGLIFLWLIVKEVTSHG